MHRPCMLACLACHVVAVCHAQTPLGTAFTYQGRLKQSGGASDGPHDFRFRLWTAAVGGAPVEPAVCVNDVPVAVGLFTVTLDFGAQFSGDERYMEIEVRPDQGGGCADGSGFTTLEPRQPLGAAPYASFALDAGALRGRPVSAAAPTANQALKWNGSAWAPAADAGLTLPFAGTVNAASALQINNTSTAANAIALHGLISSASAGSPSAGVHGQHNGAGGGGYGVWGSHAGSGIGVFATTVGGTAVYGAANGVGGANFGGWFESWGNFGRGVYGQAYGETGTNFGGYFFALGNTGRGVYGGADNATGINYGVWGQSASTSGRAVFGQVGATTGGTFGGRFETLSSSGRGVLGLAVAPTGDAVGIFGQSNSATGRAVVGWAIHATGANVGVYGRSDSAAGFGVWAEGNLGASGAKVFCIDHPDDPENRYLLHYSTESPEVINFYSGNATLDPNGETRIELPSYFARINRDPRYTLTPLGAAMPALHVKEEIDPAALLAAAPLSAGEPAPVCSFVISGGAPGGRVSWRVEALRHDAWVRRNDAPPEREKSPAERGRIQPGIANGLPAADSVAQQAARTLGDSHGYETTAP